MLSTSNVRFRYGSDSPEMAFPDLTCPAGGRLLLIGDSGTGKTTLLHLMSGLLAPTFGTVKLAGQTLGGPLGLRGKALDRFRGIHIGIVFQQAQFIQSLTVLENLALPGFLTRDAENSGEFQEQQAMEMLEKLGVGHKAHKRPRMLSVGEQQRVSIARALIHSPSILFADEPTSALDDRSTDAVVEMLETQASNAGAALVVVTHDGRLKNRYDQQVELGAMQFNLPL
jgi:putative ABC transport system ATP-binding protein